MARGSFSDDAARLGAAGRTFYCTGIQGTTRHDVRCVRPFLDWQLHVSIVCSRHSTLPTTSLSGMAFSIKLFEGFKPTGTPFWKDVLHNVSSCLPHSRMQVLSGTFSHFSMSSSERFNTVGGQLLTFPVTYCPAIALLQSWGATTDSFFFFVVIAFTALSIESDSSKFV